MFKENESGYLRQLQYSECDSQAFCSRGLEILVLSVKMLIKYDCSETFACLREAEVEEGREVSGGSEKGRGPGRFVLESND